MPVTGRHSGATTRYLLATLLSAAAAALLIVGGPILSLLIEPQAPLAVEREARALARAINTVPLGLLALGLSWPLWRWLERQVDGGQISINLATVWAFALAACLPTPLLYFREAGAHFSPEVLAWPPLLLWCSSQMMLIRRRPRPAV